MNSNNQYIEIEKIIDDLLKLKQKLLILGIGENRMGDDGAGQYISFKLHQVCKSPKIKIINGGIVPEERLDEILEFQPELMIVIDAISGKEPKGTVKIYNEKKMLNYLPISSHSMPLPVFIDRCKMGIPEVDIKLLGISPYSLQFLDNYKLFDEERYSLDDKESDINIPFYAFNLTDEIREISDNVIRIIINSLKKHHYL